MHFLFLSLCQPSSPQVWSDPILISLNGSHLPGAQSKPGSHRDTGLFLPSYPIHRRGLQVLRLNSPGIPPLLSTCSVTTLTQTVSASWLAHGHFFFGLWSQTFQNETPLPPLALALGRLTIVYKRVPDWVPFQFPQLHLIPYSPGFLILPIRLYGQKDKAVLTTTSSVFKTVPGT